MGAFLNWLRGEPGHIQASPSEQDELREEYAKAIYAQKDALDRVRRLADRSARTGQDELRALNELVAMMDEPDAPPS